MIDRLATFNERMLALLDTTGGHIAICLSLLILFSYHTNSMSHDITIFALGVLSRSMGSANQQSAGQEAKTIKSAATAAAKLKMPAIQGLVKKAADALFSPPAARPAAKRRKK
jgi:hypothetical protein